MRKVVKPRIKIEKMLTLRVAVKIIFVLFRVTRHKRLNLRIIKIFTPMIENISSSRREGCNLIKIAILRLHY